MTSRYASFKYWEKNRKYSRCCFLIFAVILLVFCLMPSSFALADGNKKRKLPKSPFEKVIYKNGSWSTQHMDIDGVNRLIVQYLGKYEQDFSVIADEDTGESIKKYPASKIKVSSKTIIKGIYIPYIVDLTNDIPFLTITFKDSSGNVFGMAEADKYPVIKLQSHAYANVQDKNDEALRIKTNDDAAVDGEGEVLSNVKPCDFIYIHNAQSISIDENVRDVVIPSEIILPPGEYLAEINLPEGMIRDKSAGLKGAMLIKGIDYKAWLKYEKELEKNIEPDIWDDKNSKEKEKDNKTEKEGNDASKKEVSFGNDELQKEIDEKNADKNIFVSVDEENKDSLTESKKQLPMEFELKEKMKIEKIILNTINKGLGALPGIIAIVDSKGNVKAGIRASGAAFAKVPNAFWVANAKVILPQGKYYLKIPDPSILSYDKEGNPDFLVQAVPAKPEMYDFTGTYMANIDVYKKSTLMGTVSGGESTFDLKNFELTVLDKGQSIEVIGKYEGMPFSQLCKVAKREENKAEAMFNLSVDLKDLPYKAKVGVMALIVLENPPGLRPSINIAGTATYERISKKQGNDYNTYSIAGKGNMRSKELPAFVIAALGKSNGSVGNVPGPASAAQAAAGMLFPPLAGVIAHVIQEAIRKTLSEDELLDIELAKKGIRKYSPAWYAAKYPGVSKETLAWIMLGDALANSDEPDDDPFSIGDNEKPGGADYVPSGKQYDSENEYGNTEESEDSSGSENEFDQDNSGAGKDYVGQDEKNGENPYDAIKTIAQSEKDKLEAERDEWLKNLEESIKSADPNDSRTQQLHGEYKEYIEYLNNKIKEISTIEKSFGQQTMTVQVDHTGRTAEIAYDPETGKWHNTESGNEFDMNRYTKDVLPDFEKDKAFIDSQRHKLETRDTEFDKFMDDFARQQKIRSNLLNSIQKIRNQAYGIEPPAPGVGDVMGNIDKLINDLNNMKIPTQELQEKAKNIAKVVIGRQTGRTMGEDEAKNLIEGVYGIKGATDRGSGILSGFKADIIDLWNDAKNISIVSNTLVESGIDVATGRTWAGMAGRAGLAVLTGGASEYVMSPAEALINIKQDIDAGESGTRAVIKAIGTYVTGELGGEYIGAAWKKTGLSINPEFANKVAKIGNTPLSEIFGSGIKSGSKESFENAVSSKSKLLLGGMGEGKPYKGDFIGDLPGGSGNAKKGAAGIADDIADYSKYKSGVKNQASVIDNKIRTGEPLSNDDIRKVLRDPSVSRELKNSHPDIQKSYQEALEKQIYTPAKKNTASKLEADIAADIKKKFGPDAKVDIEIESIRTPGKKGSVINADNDLTGKITVTDASGKKITMEIPSEKVSKVYNEEFAKASGMIKDGKFDITKAKAEMPDGVTIIGADGKPKTIPWEKASTEQQLEAFAKKHGQEVTDVRSAEAAIDFNASKNASGVSNVGQLKSGVSSAKLVDPEGLAKMEQYKINSYFNKGGIANQTEAYEQLAKMGKLTNELTGAYQKLGYNASSLPSNMQKALDIASNRNLSPGARTLELKKLGFDGPGDLANKLSSRIEGLQKLGGTSSGKAGESGVGKAVSSIIRSYLNNKN